MTHLIRHPGAATVEAMVQWAALDAMSHLLELCNVGSKSSVLVLHDRDAEELLRVATPSLERLEAEVVYIHAGTSGTYALSKLAHHQVVVEAAQRTDLTILVGSQDRLDSARRNAPTNSLPGKVLVMHPDPSMLVRFAPHRGLLDRCQWLTSRAKAPAKVDIHDELGTDMTFAPRSSTAEHGWTHESATRAYFPAGWVEMNAGTEASGTLAVATGDRNVTNQRFVESPVLIRLSQGEIIKIEGDNADANIIRALLGTHRSSARYGLRNVCVGLNSDGSAPSGPFEVTLADPWLARAYAGVLSFDFGELSQLDEPVSLTLSLTSKSVAIDSLPVLVGGHLRGNARPDLYEALPHTTPNLTE